MEEIDTVIACCRSEAIHVGVEYAFLVENCLQLKIQNRKVQIVSRSHIGFCEYVILVCFIM